MKDDPIDNSKPSKNNLDYDFSSPMIFRFPLKDVTIKVTHEKTSVTDPLISDEWNQISQHEFAMEVEGVAWYYARNGNYVEICPYEGYNQHTLELYLNGSVYGAILHQRMILPLHGSCFNYNNKGIMICGESGAGKSSLTAAFCLNGAGFLTDDVTPIVFKDEIPFIWTMSDRIKLWANSLIQLNQEIGGLHKIDPDMEKFYYPIFEDKVEFFTLNHIFVLSKHDQPDIKIQELNGVEKFITMRNEIYRWEYLEGMKDTEKDYLAQLINISKNVTASKIFRPEIIEINRMKEFLTNVINEMNENLKSI